MNQSIRQRIVSYEQEILKGDLLPFRVSEILTEIASLYGNILDQIKNTEIIYNKVLLKYLEEEKVANRAVIKSKITQEYLDLKDATNTEKVALQLIRSLGKFLKVKEHEISTLKYQ